MLTWGWKLGSLRILSGTAVSLVKVWDANEEGAKKLHVIEAGGHRSDVRSVILSDDDALLLSASSCAVKVWNPRTGACIRTVETGYGLSAIFAPGNRHAIISTKVRKCCFSLVEGRSSIPLIRMDVVYSRVQSLVF
jgi:WD40 repeat protein